MQSPQALPIPSPSSTDIDPAFRRWLRRRLLIWFRTHQRDLPWRHTRDPYAIWVSEVMLQQTTVAAVIPYFNRFLTAFPSVTALAQAPLAAVLQLWEGLGYYRRARDLHRAAQELVREHAGVVPDDPDVIPQLPGFGRYTTGAVLSQAFDRRLPILETNSSRVLCRLFALAGNPRSGPLQKMLWGIGEVILPRRNVGEFNQALMELGALVCTPVAPRCAECPLQARCVARRLGVQERLPQLPARAATVNQEEAAVVAWRGSTVLIVQRPAEARWGGLWEFPHGEVKPGEDHPDAARRLLTALTGLKGRIGPEIAVIRHGITRFRITMVCLEADRIRGEFRSDFYTQARWVAPEELPNFAFGTPQRKLAQIVGRPRQGVLFGPEH